MYITVLFMFIIASNVKKHVIILSASINFFCGKWDSCLHREDGCEMKHSSNKNLADWSFQTIIIKRFQPDVIFETAFECLFFLWGHVCHSREVSNLRAVTGINTSTHLQLKISSCLCKIYPSKKSNKASRRTNILAFMRAHDGYLQM